MASAHAVRRAAGRFGLAGPELPADGCGDLVRRRLAAGQGRGIALGATAAEAGISAAELASLVGFEDVQTALSAALKLEPFDPSQAVGWAAQAEREVEQLVDRVAGLSRVEQIPAYGAPLIEEWGQRHQHAERRLFRA